MEWMLLHRNTFFYFFAAFLLLLIVFFQDQIALLAILALALSALAIVMLNGQKQLFLFFVITLPFSFDVEITPGSNLAIFSEPLSLLFTPLLGILLWQRRNSSRLFRNPLFWASLCFILPIISAGFFSSLPLVSLKFIAINLVYWIAGCLLTFILLEDGTIRVKELITALLTGLTFIALYAYGNYAWMGFIPDSNSALSRPFFKDHTIFSATLAMILPLGFFLFAEAKEKRKKRLWLAWIILILLTIFVSSSRAAWVSVLLAAVLFFFIRSGLRLYQLVFFLLLLTSLIMLNSQSIESFVLSNRNDSNRFQSSLREQALSVTNVTNDVSNLERINRWKCALRMGRDKPFTGYGPGTYQFMYLPYQLNSEMTRISVQSQFFVKEGKGGTAHSEYLLSLSEGGFPALLGWLLFISVLFFQAFQFLFRSENKSRKYLVSLMLTGLSTYFIHGFFNNFLNTINFGVYFWMLVSLLMYIVSKKEENASPVE
jgi:O-antigen ligase